MRVLLIDVNCKYSSTGKIVYDLYNKLREEGHEAAIAYGRGEKICEENIYKFGIDVETYMHAVLARITGYNGFFSFFSTRRLIKFIDDFHPDVIHIHELHAYFVNIVPLIRCIKKNKIKVVWTFHCEYMYTGKCGYAYNCDKWKKECGKCPAVEQYPKSLLFDRTRTMFRLKKTLLQDLDVVIVTPSQWLADRVKQSFLCEKPIKVIHNGIDTQAIFYPRDCISSDIYTEYNLEEKKVVLSVAPNILEERKGGRHVLKLSEEFSDDVVFVLIGADTTMRYASNVWLIERTKDQNELAEWYSLADLFLICSNKENFPTTCLEALSCGTPVVGFDAGGTRETAPDQMGVFVDYMDYTGLKNAICDFFKVLPDKMTIRQRAVSLYAREVMCENYIAVYETQIKEKEL